MYSGYNKIMSANYNCWIIHLEAVLRQRTKISEEAAALERIQTMLD